MLHVKKISLTCQKCCKNHPRGNMYLSTTLAASTGRLSQLGASSSWDGGQCHITLYALQACEEKEDSPNVVNGLLQVNNLELLWKFTSMKYTFLFFIPYIELNIFVRPKIVSESLWVYTLGCDPVIGRWAYRNCTITISEKVTSADLVE